MDDSFKIRDLNLNDKNKGFLKLFCQLNNIKINLTSDEFNKKMNDMLNTKIVVIESKNKIVATGKIFIETKFYDSVGHIEDIVVDKNYRKLGLGKKIIEHLVKHAKNQNCYKVILSANDKVKKFYEKCNFKATSNTMSFYF